MKILALLATASLFTACSNHAPQSQTIIASEESSAVKEPISANTEDETVAPKEATQRITNTAAAIEYHCSLGEQKRVIRVLSNTADGFACKVTYEKPTGTNILWTADNDPEYCVLKAAGFVQKQVSWGWLCIDNNGNTVSVPAEPVVTPDTITTE